MRLSRYFLPILRETPKEAEIVSHRLMLRAGTMRTYALAVDAAGDLAEAEKWYPPIDTGKSSITVEK